MTASKLLRSHLTAAALGCIASLAFGADSPELTHLRDSYKAAIESATKPLTQTYLTELEKLRDNFTRAAKLEAANGVQAEIDAIYQSIAFAKAVQKLLQRKPPSGNRPLVLK